MKKILSGLIQLSNKVEILIIGSNSTLAKEFIKLVNKKIYKISVLNKKKLNFFSNDAKKKLGYYLKKKPDIIINFIGKFELNLKAESKILYLNVIPTWIIIKYFLLKKITKKTTLICLGSSSYSSPRKNYILYAASKNALNHLVRSGNEYFKDSKLSIKIFNPKTFGGKHLNQFRKKQDVEPNEVAKKIYRYIKKIKL